MKCLISSLPSTGFSDCEDGKGSVYMTSCFRTRQVTGPCHSGTLPRTPPLASHLRKLADCSLAGDEIADLPGKWKPQYTQLLYEMLVLPRAGG